MGHDPTRVVLGGRVSSIADITCEPGDPAVFSAGIAVKRGTDGKLTLAGGSPFIGVSMGSGLLDKDNTVSVARVGNFIPLRLQLDTASAKAGDITFSAKLPGGAGNDITVTIVDLLDDGSASVVVTDTDIVISIEAGVTDADAIKSAIDGDTEASALVSVAIDPGEGTTPQAAAAQTPLAGGGDYVPEPGEPVLLDPDTGLGSSDGDLTGATYVSGPLTGFDPDTRTDHPCALIALFGGF